MEQLTLPLLFPDLLDPLFQPLDRFFFCFIMDADRLVFFLYIRKLFFCNLSFFIQIRKFCFPLLHFQQK